LFFDELADWIVSLLADACYATPGPLDACVKRAYIALLFVTKSPGAFVLLHGSGLIGERLATLLFWGFPVDASCQRLIALTAEHRPRNAFLRPLRYAS